MKKLLTLKYHGEENYPLLLSNSKVNFQSRFTDVIVGLFFFRFFNSDKILIYKRVFCPAVHGLLAFFPILLTLFYLILSRN